MGRVAVLSMAMLATVAFAADKKTYHYNCRGGVFAIAAAVDASGHWSKAEPVTLQIDGEPPQTPSRMSYSGSVSPEPPAADGKSLNFGSPSFIGRTVSA